MFDSWLSVVVIAALIFLVLEVLALRNNRPTYTGIFYGALERWPVLAFVLGALLVWLFLPGDKGLKLR